MRSNFYYSGCHQKVAVRIQNYINSLQDFLSPNTIQSPRAVGDAIEKLIAHKFDDFLGNWCSEYSSEFGRRAMADMAFTDTEGIYSMVDVKTHRESTNFSMPNLTSVKRITDFYEIDTNVFSIIMVRYSVEKMKVTVSDVLFAPIEFFDWKCLSIGALGWGQIQIANASNIILNERYSRKKWMLQLCQAMLEFYPKEMEKIKDRTIKFNTAQKYWDEKEDIWM